MTVVLGVIYCQEPFECETANTSMKTDQCVTILTKENLTLKYLTKTRDRKQNGKPQNIFSNRNFYLTLKGEPVP